MWPQLVLISFLGIVSWLQQMCLMLVNTGVLIILLVGGVVGGSWPWYCHVKNVQTLSNDPSICESITRISNIIDWLIHDLIWGILMLIIPCFVVNTPHAHNIFIWNNYNHSSSFFEGKWKQIGEMRNDSGCFAVKCNINGPPAFKYIKRVYCTVRKLCLNCAAVSVSRWWSYHMV